MNSPGFRELFENCFHEYYESLYRYAFTLVRDNEQSKDIVQTVFTKWWEKKDELVIKKSIKSYLYTAVYNQSLNHLRTIKNRKTSSVDFARNQFDVAEQLMPDTTASKEIENKLKKTIEDLPPQCRLIFLKPVLKEKNMPK